MVSAVFLNPLLYLEPELLRPWLILVVEWQPAGVAAVPISLLPLPAAGTNDRVRCSGGEPNRLADLSVRLVLCLLRMDRRFRLICRSCAVLQFSDPLLQILYLLSQFRYFPVISGAVKCVTGFIGHQKQDQTRKKTAK